jgi:hypothetical protein
VRLLAQQNLVERGEPEVAVVVFNAWRDDPLLGLAQAIQTATKQTLAQIGQPRTTPSGALTFLPSLEEWSARAHASLLLILDQFEEYFLYHAPAESEDAFAVEFPRAVNRSDLRVSFLIAMREDALFRLDRFKGRIPNLFDNYLRIEHLDRAAARAAIEGPIAEYNRRLPAGSQPVSIEPSLVESVLEQVETGRVLLDKEGRGAIRQSDPGAVVRIETPYLQLVMMRLWNETVAHGDHILRQATLERLGGAGEIVRTHLDTFMSALPPDEQEIVARVFHHLVTPSGTKIAHTAHDLADYVDMPESALAPVLAKLSGSSVRILRTLDPPPDQPLAIRYEIFHDVLAPAILDWRARYLQAKALSEAAQQLERQREEAKQFAEAERRRQELADAQRVASAEHRSSQLLRWIVVVLVIHIAALSGALLLAYQQAQLAEQQTRVANEQAQVAMQSLSELKIQLEKTNAKSTEAAQYLQFLLAGLTPTSIPAIPGATATPTSSTIDPGPFAVRDLLARVSPASSISCPASFTFSADITVNRAGTLTYVWEFSNGTSTASRTINFVRAGTETVTQVATFNVIGTAGGHVKVTSLQSPDSNQATAVVNCAGLATIGAIATSAAQDDNSVSGNWVTNFGTMALSQKQTSITGTYFNAFSNSSGTIDGTIRGNVISGNWSIAGSTGTIEWTFDPLKGTITGTWNRSVLWCGARVGQALPANCGYTGAWNIRLNGGTRTMNLTQTGTLVTGTFFNGANTGTLSGSVSFSGGFAVLIGNWAVASFGTNGPLRFFMNDFAGNSFQGNYNSSNEWCGWRGSAQQPSPCLKN